MLIRFLVIGLLVPAVAILIGCGRPEVVQQEGGSHICFSDHCLDVELALTSAQRQRGLMFRESLPEGSGMLFVFDQPGKYRFRMKNTLIPLDMIRLDNSGVVTYIASGVPPCTADPCPNYGPTNGEARYVLEVGNGEAARYAITPGVVGTISE